jgi:tRNA (guanine-N7-)-methyltransferase
MSIRQSCDSRTTTGLGAAPLAEPAPVAEVDEEDCALAGNCAPATIEAVVSANTPIERHFDIFFSVPPGMGDTITARAYTTSLRISVAELLDRPASPQAVRSQAVSSDSEHPRSIRSFVTRAGRITPAQERALTALWPRFGIEFQPSLLDAHAVFGRDAPRTLEIGFGNGENLVTLASSHPERDFLGIEVHRPGVGRLLMALESRGLTNVRLVCHDAVEVLAQQIPACWLEEILVLFPDPWPKKRHHKRRLIQRPFAETLISRLANGGRLRIATDWEPYALEMLETLRQLPELRNEATAGAFVARPAERAPTRFERRGERLGHEVWDLAFRRG